MVGQGYDGAAVFSGVNTGVQARMGELTHYTYTVHANKQARGFNTGFFL